MARGSRVAERIGLSLVFVLRLQRVINFYRGMDIGVVSLPSLFPVSLKYEE